MEIIRLNPGGAVVEVRVRIEGALAWHYDYQADGARFTGRSTVPGPREHRLGTAQELNADVNAWDVHLFNPGDEAVDYAVTFVWVQGTTIIHEWAKAGGAAAGKVVAHKGDAFFVAS